MVESLVIQNLVSNDKKKFDMSEADYLIYEGSIDWGNVEVTHNTFQFPTQIGEYISNSVIGTRDISIDGWIIGDSLQDINAKKKELSKFINPIEEVKIIVDDYSIICKPTSNVQFGKTLAENSTVAVKFLLQLFAPQPLFLLTNAINVNVSDVVGMFGFPLIFKNEGIIMGYRKKSLFTDIINDGAVSVGMIITLEAIGSVNNPEFLNAKTREGIKLNKVLHAGEKVIIDTNVGERSIIGSLNGIEESYFEYMDYDSEWLQLENGVSVFTYRTYDSLGNQDETYKNLIVNVSYKTAVYNLEGE